MQNTQFKKWTSLEEDQLIDEFIQGLAIADIARKHDRSMRAIQIRLSDIAVRMKKEGKDLQEIFRCTGQTEGDITKRIEEKTQVIKKEPAKEMFNPYTQILMELRNIKEDIAGINSRII